MTLHEMFDLCHDAGMIVSVNSIGKGRWYVFLQDAGDDCKVLATNLGTHQTPEAAFEDAFMCLSAEWINKMKVSADAHTSR